MGHAAFLPPGGARNPRSPEILRVHCDLGFTAHNLHKHQDAAVGRDALELGDELREAAFGRYDPFACTRAEPEGRNALFALCGGRQNC